MTRGQIVHEVLHVVFDLPPQELAQNVQQRLLLEVQNLLVQKWMERKPEFQKLQVPPEEEMELFKESLLMLHEWAKGFAKNLTDMAAQSSLEQAWQQLKPLERETWYRSDGYKVRGIIDCIEHRDGVIRVMDYKTSKRFELDEHMVQLAIYSLLYADRHGKPPDQVGIYFLKGPEVAVLPVDQELLELARKEIRAIHENTISRMMRDYPKQRGWWCKWKGGKCDFYDVCKPDDPNAL